MSLIPSSHTSRPSPILALLAASIVAAYDRAWLARPVQSLCAQLGVRPEVPSRLKKRLLAPLEALVARATRRGRPVQERHDLAPRLRAAEALLAVAADLLGHLEVRPRALQDRLVLAQQRIAAEHGISRRDFCQALGLSERTFRAWASRKPQTESVVQTPPPPPRKRPRRGRFALEVVPAGIQALGDTTDWKLFEVPLKILAVQDPGARHVRLWEASEVATREDSDTVIRVVEQALGNRPGTQILTDQGTPYLSTAATQAYQDLGLDHAPQKEADPFAKATLERSFGVVKTALEPLSRLTNQLAQTIPALRSEPLAASLGRLLVATFLSVYLTARSAQLGPGSSLDPAAFEALAENNRDQARAEDRSVRLTLERIHAQYDMPRSRQAFVRAFRHNRVEDLLEAERRMGDRACRCHAKRCDRYFAAVLRRVVVENNARRRIAREQTIKEASERAQYERMRQEKARLEQDPERWVVYGLDRAACFWMPERGRFVFDEEAFQYAELRRAVERLAQSDPLACRDRVEIAWNRWVEGRPGPDEKLTTAMRQVLNRVVQDTVSPAPPLTENLAGVILKRNENRRPPPRPPLRI